MQLCAAGELITAYRHLLQDSFLQTFSTQRSKWVLQESMQHDQLPAINECRPALV